MSLGADRRRGVRLAVVVSVVAAALAIPAAAQAWTAGTDSGDLVLRNDVAGDLDFYDIGFVAGSPGFYQIEAATADAHVFGNCIVTSELNVVDCSPTGITNVDVTGETRGPDIIDFDTANGKKAPLPRGVTTTVRTFKGKDSVIGSRNRDVLLGGAAGDTLSGAGGNDRVNGGTGEDSLYGGGGRDLLQAADGTADLVIDCGPDADQAAVFDTCLDPAPVNCG